MEQREIKFRAVIKGKVYKSFDLYEDLTKDQEGDVFEKSVIFLQFTGLTDKNEKDIYDKDVIKTPAGIGYIEMSNGVTWIHWNMEDSTTLYDCKTVHLEIIGNIYENPELIKSKI